METTAATAHPAVTCACMPAYMLSIYLPTCLSICLPVYLSACLPACLAPAHCEGRVQLHLVPVHCPHGVQDSITARPRPAHHTAQLPVAAYGHSPSDWIQQSFPECYPLCLPLESAS